MSARCNALLAADTSAPGDLRAKMPHASDRPFLAVLARVWFEPV